MYPVAVMVVIKVQFNALGYFLLFQVSKHCQNFTDILLEESVKEISMISWVGGGWIYTLKFIENFTKSNWKKNPKSLYIRFDRVNFGSAV